MAGGIGQLAATTPAAIISPSGGTKPNTVTLVFYNEHATDDQEIQLELTRSGQTARMLAKATIKKKEQFIVCNLSMEPTDTLKSAATAATSVNYAILPGHPGGLFDCYSLDATGARKATAVASGWSFTSDVTFPDNVAAVFGTGSDITFKWDATDLIVSQAAADSIIKWGVDGAGINHLFYGDTAGRHLMWDQTNDQLIALDNTKISIGSGAGSLGDISFSWNATKLLVAQLTTNSAIDWGVDDDGIDQNWYGATASAKAMWDQSADSLIFSGAAGIQNLKVKQSTAVAITGATTLVLADSGGAFTVSQAAAYDIDLPSPTTGAGASYYFSVTAPGANNVTITVLGGAATFVGSIITEGQIIVATGSTLTIASGVAVLGDTIEIRSLATNLYSVRAISSILNGITVA